MTGHAATLPRERDTAGPRGPVLVVAAMREELAALVGRLDGARRVQVAGGERAWTGTLRGRPIVAAASGVGARNAARRGSALLERFPAQALVGVGVAGGLTPELEPGALVIAAAVHGGADGTLRPDPAWIERALRVQGTLAGTLVTAERVLGTAADKAAVRAAFRVSGPAAVDMESAAWAGAAARHGVPCVFARAVCDTASDDLPLDLEGCRDETGEIRRARVAGSLLLNPSAAPALWELRRRLRACSVVLAGFVEELLQ